MLPRHSARRAGRGFARLCPPRARPLQRLERKSRGVTARAVSAASSHPVLMAVEPDAFEMAEQRRELVAVGVRQCRLEQRRNIGAQMFGVAGAEQDDVDARLVPREATGCLDQIGRALLVKEKAERI